MLILFVALIFGIVILLFLLKGMPNNFGAQLHGYGREKVRAIIRLILLVEVVAYILLFIVIIIKTIFL